MSDNIATATYGTRVRLSDGSEFYALAPIEDVAPILAPRPDYVLIGDRYVNTQQVCQLTWEVVPSLAEVEIALEATPGDDS